jgi:alpha-ketoglutaric semialdehyde dehydrogenase
MIGGGPVAVGHHIGGTWGAARDDVRRTNPARPAEEVSRAPIATDREVDDAVAAASGAFRAWRAMTSIRRGAVLHAAANLTELRSEELVDLMVREAGKLVGDARGEVGRTVDTLRYNAELGRGATGQLFGSSDPSEEVRTVRVPVGVVALVTPWNFPLAIPAWKLAPALVHGNTVVWKPAPETPAVSAAFMRILADAGLPAGVCNLVHGGAEVGRRIVAAADVAAVSFTGSVAAGADVAATASGHGARYQLECGGHNPALVFGDADLELAAGLIVAGAMGAAGQKCTATRRVIVVPEVREPLLDRILVRVAALRVGDPSDPRTDVGPLISAAARDRVLAAVAQATSAGAELLAGGHALDGGRALDGGLQGGHLVAPTVLGVDDPEGVELCWQEVFGPVTAVLDAEDEEAAFALANATEYGLAAAVFTGDPRRIRRSIEELAVGVVHVNGPTTGAELHVPFGGVKRSGSAAWREQGETARDFYTELRTAYVRPATVQSTMPAIDPAATAPASPTAR